MSVASVLRRAARRPNRPSLTPDSGVRLPPISRHDATLLSRIGSRSVSITNCNDGAITRLCAWLLHTCPALCRLVVGGAVGVQQPEWRLGPMVDPQPADWTATLSGLRVNGRSIRLEIALVRPEQPESSLDADPEIEQDYQI